jgi:hypothetical protein
MLEPWNPETMDPCKSGNLALGTLEPWNPGTLEPRKP